MDPFTIIQGIGLATQAFGMWESNKAADKQKDVAAAQTQLNIQASGVKQKAAASENRANVELIRVSREQEKLRKKAMNIEATRMQREIVRNAQMARAEATAGAANSGGLKSSGIQGVQAQITSGQAAQSATVFENRQRGRKQFQLNAEIFSIQARNARAQGAYTRSLSSLETRSQTLGVQSNNASSDANFGKSLFSLGGSLIQNAEPAANSLTSLFGK